VGLPTALIVCEGTQTEPNYLTGLTDELNINRANVEIDKCIGVTDPRGLLKRAHTTFKLTPDFDKIFILLDGDQIIPPKVLAEAKNGPRKSDGNRAPIEFVRSTPCFEYWILLHFEYTTRAFQNCAAVINALEAHLPGYRKSDPNIFKMTQSGFNRAYGRAKRANDQAAQTGASSPISEMPVLIDVLRTMIR